MDHADTLAWLRRELPKVSEVPLSPRQLRLDYVLNSGGFTNYSFRVEDSGRRFHLKLAEDPEMQARLQAWYALRELLESRYRAPRILQWLDFKEIGLSGLMQEHINGRTADFAADPRLLKQLLDLAGRWHLDSELAGLISSWGNNRTCLDHFVETYIDRFTADLQIVRTAPVPFVSTSLFEWMQDETGRLKADAEKLQSFHNPAAHPVHGDLHQGNVLVARDDWFVVDWDDLRIGDPAIDFAVALWPVVYDGGSWQEWLQSEDGDLAERIEICLRAQLLDEVIDPLADYVECDKVPEYSAEVKVTKEQRHIEALETYRAAWP